MSYLLAVNQTLALQKRKVQTKLKPHNGSKKIAYRIVIKPNAPLKEGKITIVGRPSDSDMTHQFHKD